MSAFSNYKRINSNKYNKQNWIWEKKRKMSLVPVRKTNRYQMGCHLASAWQPLWYRLVFPTGTNGSLRHRLKKPGVLRRGHWSRLWGTGWETSAFSPSQPVPKDRFLVVFISFLLFLLASNCKQIAKNKCWSGCAPNTNLRCG